MDTPLYFNSGIHKLHIVLLMLSDIPETHSKRLEMSSLSETKKMSECKGRAQTTKKWEGVAFNI